MKRSDQEAVRELLEMVGDLSGNEVEAYFGGEIRQNDISRWTLGKWSYLLPKKRRAVNRILDVWDSLPPELRVPGKKGVEAVALRIGTHTSERVKRLTRWIAHPDILPRDLSFEERERIGRATMDVEEFSLAERQQFNAWCDQQRESQVENDEPRKKRAAGR